LPKCKLYGPYCVYLLFSFSRPYLATRKKFLQTTLQPRCDVCIKTKTNEFRFKVGELITNNAIFRCDSIIPKSAYVMSLSPSFLLPVFLSVCPSGCNITALPELISMKSDTAATRKMCRGSPNLFTIGQKYEIFYVKTKVCFNVATDMKVSVHRSSLLYFWLGERITVFFFFL
jgi:hypothetical protein